MKRVITLDVLRGIAIFMVIVSHVFIYAVDLSILDPASGNIVALIFLAPLIFLGKWKGFFLMISASSQVYSMHKGFEGKSKPIIVFLKQIISALLLLVVAYVFKIFLLPGATFYQYIFNGVWDPSSRLQANLNTIIFQSIDTENLPGKFLAKLTVDTSNKSILHEKFELAPKGKEFTMCIKTTYQISS